MGGAWRIFYAVVASVGALALSVLAYKITFGSLQIPEGLRPPAIDYTNIVVILLTTVTVIFSVCALALAVLGVMGFRSLKKEAAKFASERALSEISAAFNDGGRAHIQIQNEFIKEDGHFKKWVEKRVRQEVIALLPLVIDRLKASSDLGLDEDAPTDEGEVE